MSAMLVSTLPVKPEAAITAASASSPRRMSLNFDPDRPSTDSNRASVDATDSGTGVSSKARKFMSTFAAKVSCWKTAQSKPEAPR